MECRNHPTSQAVDRCTGCAEAFCPSCLVEVHGQKYCGACKMMALKGAPMVEEATVPCKEAKDAFVLAIVGAAAGIFLCLGFVLGPLAISKGFKARKQIEMNPQLSGSGQATAAITLGIIDVLLGVLSLVGAVENQVGG